MSIQKKSLISTLKTTKKANAANSKEGLKAEKTQNLKLAAEHSLKMRSIDAKMRPALRMKAYKA